MLLHVGETVMVDTPIASDAGSAMLATLMKGKLSGR
jgi:hypothetical protein